MRAKSEYTHKWKSNFDCETFQCCLNLDMDYILRRSHLVDGNRRGKSAVTWDRRNTSKLNEWMNECSHKISFHNRNHNKQANIKHFVCITHSSVCMHSNGNKWEQRFLIRLIYVCFCSAAPHIRIYSFSFSLGFFFLFNANERKTNPNVAGMCEVRTAAKVKIG